MGHSAGHSAGHSTWGDHSPPHDHSLQQTRRTDTHPVEGWCDSSDQPRAVASPSGHPRRAPPARPSPEGLHPTRCRPLGPSRAGQQRSVTRMRQKAESARAGRRDAPSMSCSPPICSWRAEAVVEGLSVDERAWLRAMAMEAGRTPQGGSCPSRPRTSIGVPACGGPPTSPPCCRPPTSRALRHGDQERSEGPNAPSPSGLTPKWVACTYRVLLHTHRVLAL